MRSQLEMEQALARLEAQVKALREDKPTVDILEVGEAGAPTVTMTALGIRAYPIPIQSDTRVGAVVLMVRNITANTDHVDIGIYRIREESRGAIQAPGVYCDATASYNVNNNPTLQVIRKARGEVVPVAGVRLFWMLDREIILRPTTQYFLVLQSEGGYTDLCARTSSDTVMQAVSCGTPSTFGLTETVAAVPNSVARPIAFTLFSQRAIRNMGR